jgi:predicted glycosyltransferase
VNIYLLSQHNIGLGHLNRTALLAGELGNLPGACVFHFSCGPSPGIINPNRNVEFIELPSLVVKNLSNPALTSLERGKTKKKIEKDRREIVLRSFRRNQPDLFITEFFPFSPHRLDGTVMPLLEFIKKKHPECGVICSVRDIPLCHGEKLTSRKIRHISSVLKTYYDLILVHSDYSVIKVEDIRGYQALRSICPIEYTGYIARPTRPSPTTRRKTGLTRILVTVGGGRDGHRIIESALRAARLKPEYLFDIVCGPLMPEKKIDCIRAFSQRLMNVRIFPFLRELKDAVPQYDLLICAGGYNTVVEAVANRKRCISIPRRGSYEQKKRVNLFSKRNLLWSIADSRLTAKNLSKLIEEALYSRLKPRFPIDMDGLRKTTSAIRDRFPAQYPKEA